MAETSDGKEKQHRNKLKSVLGGNLLASEQVLKQIPFVFFLVFLSILMIANRYWSEKTIRRTEAVQDSIKLLKMKSVTYETELMKMSRPSAVSEKIKASGLDLREPQEPARRLIVKDE